MYMKCLNMTFGFILLLAVCQGMQALLDYSRSPRRTPRDNFFVIKNTREYGLLAVWDQTQSRENCQDTHPSCPYWGEQGECHHNPNYMVPNCAYTCNTCLTGVRHPEGIRGCMNNAQEECDIVTRENSNRVRDGIIREASAVSTRTVDNIDTAATEAALTPQGILAGIEILMIVAEAVGSSAREYAMGCRDMSTMCPSMASQGNCQSNSSFMLVNCPVSCESCLPTVPAECVDKGDKDSCELSSTLGLCEVNYSYNLRFCAGACKTTQSLVDKCTKEGGSPSCIRKKSLRTPDFKCGIPSNRRKRLAVSITPTQLRGARRLKESSRVHRKKNKKNKRYRNKHKHISEETMINNSTAIPHLDINLNSSALNETSRVENLINTNISWPQLDSTLNTSELNASSRQEHLKDSKASALKASSRDYDDYDSFACCSLFWERTPRFFCGTDRDVFYGGDFACSCCSNGSSSGGNDRPDTRIGTTERIASWPGVLAGGLLAGIAASSFLPGAVAVAPVAAAAAIPAALPAIAALPALALTASVGLGAVTGIFPGVPLLPMITIPVITDLPPLAAIAGITSIPDTIDTRRAAQSLIPFCDANGYLALLMMLSVLISSNTGKPLDLQAFDITEALTYCRQGVGQVPPILAVNITTETGFGNVSNQALKPPTNYPGVSFPGLKNELGDIETAEISGIAALGIAGETQVNDRFRFFCGASLITKRHILTAAHCVVNENQMPEVIRLGESDFTTTEESKSADYKVRNITRHPDYKLLSSYNDIAVIELFDEVTVERSGNLLPYCLPSEPLNLVGLTCTVSGWGTRPNTLASTVILNPNVTVRSLDECKSLYGINEVFRIVNPRGFADTSLCAAGEDMMDACRGDSGGPLVLNSGVNIATEVGIVSQGVGCGDPRFPGIYTRTDAFIDWLDEVVYGEENEAACP